jgi:diketogulonate reductase-like aldo/keto reductase
VGLQVEKEVGLAFKESGISRSDIFVTTKFWPNFARVPGLSLDLSLDAMQLEYVDLFLIHWPVAFVPDGDLTAALGGDPPPDKTGIKWEKLDKPLIDVDPSASLLSMWKKMEQLQREGKAKALGVSNCTISDLEELLPHVSPDTPLCVNQVEAHPWFPNNELIDYCKSKGIIVEAYCPMGGGTSFTQNLINEPVIKNIASQRGWG